MSRRQQVLAAGSKVPGSLLFGSDSFLPIEILVFGNWSH